MAAKAKRFTIIGDNKSVVDGVEYDSAWWGALEDTMQAYETWAGIRKWCTRLSTQEVAEAGWVPSRGKNVKRVAPQGHGHKALEGAQREGGCDGHHGLGRNVRFGSHEKGQKGSLQGG